MSITLDTPEQIQGARLLMLRQGLTLETKGLRLSRGRTAYSIIKEEFGFKGNKIKVLEQFEEMLEDFGI
tara:strand:- start:50 stop:256 length:207 start_codon:yes stop_codon:yes gene_type:complete